jgi:DNA-binding beta-propeller fold protein YncE
MVELGGTGQPSGHVHAFVHVLNLSQGWAFCLDLPVPFGLGPASAHALAVARDGRRLYVADAASGVVVDADTDKLQLARRADLGTEPFADWSRSAAQAGPGGTLYLASGSEVVVVDPAGLRPEHRWPVDGVARGLGVSPDGRRVYAGLDGRVAVLDAHTGRPIATRAVPGLETILHVGTAAA